MGENGTAIRPSTAGHDYAAQFEPTFVRGELGNVVVRQRTSGEAVLDIEVRDCVRATELLETFAEHLATLSASDFEHRWHIGA